MIQRERVVEEKADYFLLLFLILVFLSFIPALINGVNMFYWFRELIPFLSFILFFLVITEVKNEKHILYIILSIFAVSASFAINNILTYLKLLADVRYFWEILSSRQVVGEINFTSSLILGLCLLISPIPKKYKLIIIPFVLIMGLSLALTFSRGYWIAFILATFILFIISKKREKISLFLYGVIFAVILFLFVSLYFGGLSGFVGISFLKRFPSINDIFTDISFLNRISEMKGLLKSIKYYFVSGAGLGARFDYFDIIFYRNFNTWYSHNAFLYLLFKLGLPSLISFLCFYFIVIKYGFSLIKTSTNVILNNIAKGTVALLISMFFLSVSSPQFFQKDSVLIITLLSGLVRNFHKKYCKVKLEQKD